MSTDFNFTGIDTRDPWIAALQHDAASYPAEPPYDPFNPDVSYTRSRYLAAISAAARTPIQINAYGIVLAEIDPHDPNRSVILGVQQRGTPENPRYSFVTALAWFTPGKPTPIEWFWGHYFDTVGNQRADVVAMWSRALTDFRQRADLPQYG